MQNLNWRKENISSQIVRGVEFMHQHHVAHRDIKPGNIVLGEDLSVKILDFGIGKMLALLLYFYS